MANRVSHALHAPERPWYREPWPWVLIAIPLATVVACGFTLWLAISHPDYLVLDEPKYQAVAAGLKADAKPGTEAGANANAKAEDEEH